MSATVETSPSEVDATSTPEELDSNQRISEESNNGLTLSSSSDDVPDSNAEDKGIAEDKPSLATDGMSADDAGDTASAAANKEDESESIHEGQENSLEHQQAPNGGPAIVYPPIPLRGFLDADASTWAGEWAMNPTDYENGLRGKFEYKRTGKQPDTDVGKPPALSGQPADMYVTGYFTLKKGDKQTKIPEKDILVRFTATNPEGPVTVQGFGKNPYGTFTLNGTFDLATRALDLNREYQIKPLQTVLSSQKLKRKTTTPRALGATYQAGTPGQFGENNLGWTSAAAASAASGPAAAVAQRIRRQPSHLLASENELNKKVTEVMLPIVNNLLKMDSKNQLFWRPVDAALLGLADYNERIPNPMDLGTVKTKLSQSLYETEDQVAADVELTFTNAMTYNPAGNSVHDFAKMLFDHFQQEREALERKRQEREKKRAKSLPAAAEPAKRQKAGSKGKSEAHSDDEYESEAAVVATSAKLSKSKRPSAAMDSASSSLSANGVGPQDNEELRLLRRQVEMMSQQLETLKTMQSQQLSLQSQQLQITGASPRHMDPDYHAPVAGPKRPRAPPKTKQPRPTYVDDLDIDDDAIIVEGGGASRPAAAKLERPLTYNEKKTLGQDINKLPGDKVQRVIDIIQENGNQMGGDGAEEVEIDIEKLDTNTLRTLQKYVRDVLRGEKKKVSKEGYM